MVLELTLSSPLIKTAAKERLVAQLKMAGGFTIGGLMATYAFWELLPSIRESAWFVQMNWGVATLVLAFPFVAPWLMAWAATREFMKLRRLLKVGVVAPATSLSHQGLDDDQSYRYEYMAATHVIHDSYARKPGKKESVAVAIVDPDLPSHAIILRV